MLTMNDIVREGHGALRKKSVEVMIPPNTEDVEILGKMLEFLMNSQDEDKAEKCNLRPGVGLAAPQLGINKRMMAVHFEDSKEKLFSFGIFNPKIVSHSVEIAYLEDGEGCLSVDRHVDGYVSRYARITISGFDLDLKPIKIRLKDYAAIVFQHEIDHLNGIMFYDHINKNNPFLVPDHAKAL